MMELKSGRYRKEEKMSEVIGNEFVIDYESQWRRDAT